MSRISRTLSVAVAATTLIGLASTAAAGNGWEGKRCISCQRPNDLFYNHYVGPCPNGTGAQMYVAPLPVPAAMGHHYTTYQPLMPHEMLYRHHRAYYTHRPGAGWTRTNVRYSTGGNLLQRASFGLFDDVKPSFFRNADFFTHIEDIQMPALF